MGTAAGRDPDLVLGAASPDRSDRPPGVAAEPVETPTPWRWAGASVVGASHAGAGTPCQDAYAAAVRADGAWVAAVADGAGSAPHSARGAAVAVAAAVGTLLRAGDRSTAVHAGSADLAGAGDERMPGLIDNDDAAAADVAAAVRAAGAAIAALAEADGLPARELACTLSCAVVGADGAVAAQVGDGLVVTMGPDGGLTALTVPDRGDYANETAFLTTPGAIDACLAGMRRAVGRVDGVALLTDGLLRLAMRMSDGAPHEAFFGPLFQFAASAADPAAAGDALAAFLAAPRVRARTDDDVTLVVAARGASRSGR